MTVGGQDIFTVQGSSVSLYSGGRWVPVDTSGIPELRGERRLLRRQFLQSDVPTIVSIAVEGEEDIWVVLSSGSVWEKVGGEWVQAMERGSAAQVAAGGNGAMYLVGFGGTGVMEHSSSGGASQT